MPSWLVPLRNSFALIMKCLHSLHTCNCIMVWLLYLQQQIAKRMHTLSRGLAVSSGHAVPPAAYSKHSSIIPSTKPLSSGANPASSTGLQYQMDGSYPVATSVTSSQLYNKSNSRHGLATFSSRAEQQSIFKPPIGVAPNNQKYVDHCSIATALIRAHVDPL